MNRQITCPNCGIVFEVHEDWLQARFEDLRIFYCPNGHELSYKKSPLQALQEKKEQMERSLQAQLNEARHAQLVAEKAAKKALSDKRKVERRIAHGVCPCCNKVFADLSNHMMENHKDYRLPEGKKPAQIEAPKTIQ